jgi:ParB family chromosome partitioning protein
MKLLLSDILSDAEFNCRGSIDPESVEDLAASMQAQGLICPIVVAAWPDPPWRVVAGHRRVAAARRLLWDKIEAVIMEEMTDLEAAKINLQENLGRRDLTPSQEMRGIIHIYGDNPDPKVVAAEMKLSTTWVRHRLSIRKLEACIQRDIDKGLLTALDISHLISAPVECRVDIAKELMQAKAQGVAGRVVAAKHKLTKTRRNKTTIKAGLVALGDMGITPHYREAMLWCAGDVTSEDFFGRSLEKLAEYGITY